jgi:chemotaxis protein CheZ
MSINSEKQAEHDAILKRVGNLTRMLRMSIRELGLDREVESAAKAIPDARDRLSYIASMTEKAADRVLDSVDIISPLQRDIQERTAAYKSKISKLTSGQPITISSDELKDLTDYLNLVEMHSVTTSTELTEITMAQDYQDLTGQVIKKMIPLINSIENQLVQVLMDASPEKTRDIHVKRMTGEMSGTDDTHSNLSGPRINKDDNNSSNQNQVDNLLDELGF